MRGGSIIQYGFERLVLLGSAGHQRAELPLDAAVLLIAPHNTGKTSLINALQVLLIIDQRRMDFGAHVIWRSPNDSRLPNKQRLHTAGSLSARNGDRGAGMCRQGVSHDYQYCLGSVGSG